MHARNAAIAFYSLCVPAGGIGRPAAEPPPSFIGIIRVHIQMIHSIDAMPGAVKVDVPVGQLLWGALVLV